MEYRNVIRDFAERTRANLELVERTAADPGGSAHEFTQLVNSMLGLLVFPKEEYYTRIPRDSLKQLRKKGWPVPDTAGDLPPAKDLRELIRYMRNAITHFNIEFHASGNGELVGLTLWNLDGGASGPKTWQAFFTGEQLRDLTFRFVDVLTGPRNGDAPSGGRPSQS